MPKLTQYAAAAGTAATALEALFEIYEAAEPSAKTWVEGEITKVSSAFSAIMASVSAFKSASILGKVSSGITLLSSVLDITTVAEGVISDAKTQFAPVWPQIVTQVNVLKGLPAVVSAPVAAAPAAAPVAPAAEPAAEPAA